MEFWELSTIVESERRKLDYYINTKTGTETHKTIHIERFCLSTAFASVFNLTERTLWLKAWLANWKLTESLRGNCNEFITHKLTRFSCREDCWKFELQPTESHTLKRIYSLLILKYLSQERRKSSLPLYMSYSSLCSFQISLKNNNLNFYEQNYPEKTIKTK